MVVADRIAHRDQRPRRQLQMSSVHRIGVGVLLTLALGISAAPASARPFDINSAGSYVPAGSASVRARSHRAIPTRAASAPATIVRVVDRNSGFDWTDAVIGAAGGLALSIVAYGAVTQRRGRRARHATATTH
jgi:hypothetical protein